MKKALAINGSPRMARGNTALVLGPFLKGLADGGFSTELLYASQLKVKPCSCGNMHCWNDTPGKCIFQDSMQEIYPKLWDADLLILATPVYIPLPGEMQNFVNRLVPLLIPDLVIREGRTRARFREDVKIKQIALVAIGGWYELENMDVVELIVREIAENASCEYCGALKRPHSSRMGHATELTPGSKAVQAAARQAGVELAHDGQIQPATLARVSQPLIENWVK